ncbi:MAG: VCBS repeat-containing protein, partial [Bacteroidota bacterium]
IYVCRSGALKNNGRRQNRLFINQRDGTFREEAEKWQLNDPGFSTQSYFFDYDKDGDLDMYLVNHRVDFENTARLDMRIEQSFSRFTSDKLYRNDGTWFTEVTHKAKMVNKAWGLSASIGDFNGDNWPDVYVCNDFLTPDILYINNRNGTFSNQILDRINHISFSSMGSDYADFNNDLFPDLLVLEMASEDHIRSKENMASMNTGAFWNLVRNDYHYQYMQNTLQLNSAKGKFSEIAQLSGIAKTDWSWAPLIADFDNDGFKDVFITNGILKDMGNQDFRTELVQRYTLGDIPDFQEVTQMLPSHKLANYSYRNNRDYTFTNTSKSWGFDKETQSNGVAYADFDNDGDLDLVINNINDGAMLYRNNDAHNFLQIRLHGNSKNTFAIGAKVTVSTLDGDQYQELYMSRGFLSSVQNILNFGVGTAQNVARVKVEWPNGQITELRNVAANQILVLDQEKADPVPVENRRVDRVLPLSQINSESKGISFKHSENPFDDFKEQILLPHSQSKNGPFIDKADVNGDGLDDFYIGGASGQSGELYYQQENGTFSKDESPVWQSDKSYEDLGVLFFDADSDTDQDLYVVSGGSENPEGSAFFQDRLYINDGRGNFRKGAGLLPRIRASGQLVQSSDIDGDGDLDLFVGGSVVQDKYPYAPRSYMLINDKGKFTDMTEEVAPGLSNIGMVTDASFTDYDNDGDEDLILVGEWMPITTFRNTAGSFAKVELEAFKDTEGIWFSIAANDLDKDGDMDYFVGNLGKNTKFKASVEKPFHVFCDDFDNSGSYDIVLTNNYKGSLVPLRGRECSSQQMPFIGDKFKTYHEFANASLIDIYGARNLENALHLQSKTLTSVFLENRGNDQFSIHQLPNTLQMAPIMDFEFVDLNGDDFQEVIAIGNHYHSEVETVRYDASYGAVLTFVDGMLLEQKMEKTGFFNEGNSKDMVVLETQEKDVLLITNNDDTPNVFEINPDLDVIE